MTPETSKLNRVNTLLAAGREALASSSDSARLDTEVLLAHALQANRAWLYANPEAAVAERKAEVFRLLLGQRAAGRPVAQLTGQREFWSLVLEVNEHTLIPRPETEVLVECALRHIPAQGAWRILDLGTGSGAIAIALATERPAAQLVATDRDPQALAIAQANARRLCPQRVEFLAGDWWSALPADSKNFDLIISNPPYIGTGESALTDPELAFEPVAALYSGKDGLDAIRVIVEGASRRLHRGGRLLLEHGFAQAPAVAELLRAAGYTDIRHSADPAGHLRVTEAQWPD